MIILHDNLSALNPCDYKMRALLLSRQMIRYVIAPESVQHGLERVTSHDPLWCEQRSASEEFEVMTSPV